MSKYNTLKIDNLIEENIYWQYLILNSLIFKKKKKRDSYHLTASTKNEI